MFSTAGVAFVSGVVVDWHGCDSSLFTRLVDGCDVIEMAEDDVSLANDDIHCVLTSRGRMQ